MMYLYAENSQKVGLLITKQQTISQSLPLEVESYAELRAPANVCKYCIIH